MDGRAALECEALHEIARVVALTADINKALNSALGILRSTLGMENGTVSLYDAVTGDVFIEAAPEMTDAERIQGRLRPGEGIVGRIFDTGMPMVIPDIATEPLFLNRTGSWRNLSEDPRAFLGVPIRDGRVTLGVLTIDRRWRAGPFVFDRDVRLLGTVASILGARVRLSQVQDPVRRAASEEAPAGSEPERFPGIVTRSARLRDVLELVARVAQSRATVFLRGESGTGKELIARLVHDRSPRAGRPFVALNCAAIPDSLVESEIFGHERGAFTGAVTAQKGRFEMADGGTLFLDEVGELPLAVQAKLLRVLQERQFERIGGRRPVTVDVRLVAATNRDLEEAVRHGRFRLDLYHRLSVVTVALPPLRERPEDVDALAEHYLRVFNEENARSVRLGPGVLDRLRCCRWSGNVRQLRNCVERLVVSAREEIVTAPDLYCAAGCFLEEAVEAPLEATPARPQASDPASLAAVVPAANERDRIVEALHRTGFVKARAARLLGMTERQLAYRVRKYDIPVERF